MDGVGTDFMQFTWPELEGMLALTAHSSQLTESQQIRRRRRSVLKNFVFKHFVDVVF